jgi:hypothetical protein
MTTTNGDSFAACDLQKLWPMYAEYPAELLLMLNWVHEVKLSSMGSIFSLYALLANVSIVAIVINLLFRSYWYAISRAACFS